MKNSTRPSRRFAAGLLVICFSCAITLSACGADPSEELAERMLEKAADGSVGVDIDDEASSMTITGDDGSVVFSSSELPDDFPDNVPLIEGNVLAAASSSVEGGSGWSVSMQTDRPASEVTDEAKRLFDDAGYAEDESGTVIIGETTIMTLSGNGWQVSVSIAESESEGTVVQYVVIAATD